ncbi:MAG: class I SAM-dependent methyltransferase [Desulfovibrionaceae bacterium]
MTIPYEWETVFRNGPWGAYPGEDLIRFVARNFYAAPDRGAVSILEVGCGPGANLWYLCREGFRAVGVDGSETAIRQARERLDREVPGWRGDILRADIIRLPLADAAFDAVVDSEALSCNTFEDSQRIYGEMLRVLRPGGRLFSRTFAQDCYGNGMGRRVGRGCYESDRGPFTGKGRIRFTRLEEIGELLGPRARLLGVERICRTMGDRAQEIVEWIIEAERLPD